MFGHGITRLGITRLALGLAGTLVAATALAQASPAPAASARQLELAHRYVLAIHMDKTMDGAMKTMLPAMLAQMPKNPDISPAERQAIAEVTAEVTSGMMTKFVAQMEPIMAETFTEKELGDLVAFYEGPTGQSLIAKTPQVMSKMAPRMAELLPQMRIEMTAKLCARIDCARLEKSATPKPS